MLMSAVVHKRAREGKTDVVGDNETDKGGAVQDGDPFPIGLDIEDRKKWFASKLEGLTREECILVAGRASLRVVPIWLNGSFRSAVDRYSRDTLHYVVLPILRCQFITAIASIAPSQQKGAFKSAAIGSAKAIHRVAFEESETLASLAANIAVDAVNIIMAGSDIDAVSLAIQVADQATHATTLSVPNVAFYAGAVDAVVSAFVHDVNYLKSSSLAALAVEPLWPKRKFSGVLGLGANEGELLKFEIPNFFRQSWDTFERLLNEAGDDWDVWAEWFRCVVDGKRVGTFLFVLPTQNALTLWRKVALLDDAVWNAGPATLNAEFKRLVEEARREVGSSLINYSTQETTFEQTQKLYSPTTHNVDQSKGSLYSAINELKDLHDEMDGYFVELDRNLDAHIEAANSELQKLTEIAARQPWREEIERLELLRSLTTELREVVKRLGDGKANNDEAKERVRKFREGSENWWQKRHVQVLDKTFNFGLNATGFSVYMIVGSAVGLVAGAPYLGMLCGAAAHSGKDALNKVINKATKILS